MVEQESAEWQAATEAPIMAAADRGPLMHAETAVFSLISCFHCIVTAPHYGAPPEPHSGRAGMRIIPAPGLLIYASPT